jgi:type II restriction/modification system DNA methylase subunit YeeA
MIERGTVERAGLVATQAIRRGASRVVLDRIGVTAPIYDAWADQPWAVEGAAVRVSLVCFGREGVGDVRRLDGQGSAVINTDLSGSATDATKSVRLRENAGTCFQGPVKVGAFDVPGDLARTWLALPVNPNGRPNADVVRPLINGMDIAKRPTDPWIIDFGDMSEAEASLFEAPFEHVRMYVRPFRSTNRRERRKLYWWHHGETVPGLRKASQAIQRLVLTPRVAKHRLFIWAGARALPDSRVNAIARDDNTTFGTLHSRFHELWSVTLGGWHGVGNDPQYTPSTGFETFPFPHGLTPNIPAADYAADLRAQRIADAAARLDELRNNWLNPADLVRRVPEVVPGYPDRLLPVDDKAAAILKKRTLTNLYNERPAWLANAHRDLDEAVAAAYGWPADLADDDILARLLALNQERAAAQAGDKAAPVIETAA